MYKFLCGEIQNHAIFAKIVVRYGRQDLMSTLLTDLEDSRTVLFAHHVDDPNIGMGLTENLTRYKMFACDTGLFYHIWPKDDKHYYEIAIISNKSF